MRDGLIIGLVGALGLLWTGSVRRGATAGWSSPTRRRGFCWSFPFFFSGLVAFGVSLVLQDRPALDPARTIGLWTAGVGLVLLLLSFASALGWPHPRWMMPFGLRRREDRDR